MMSKVKLAEPKRGRWGAFTLVEVLGAVAVIATLTAVSVVSIKDSVAAGQRSALQRELQHLNTSLQNFKSAGGVIPEDADASEAVAALMLATDLAGSDFTVLVSAPKMNSEVGGEPYELSYHPMEGFSYVRANGSGLAFAGVEVDSTGELFSLNEEGVADGLQTFASMGRNDPSYQQYLSSLALAMGLDEISAELKALIEAELFDAGYLFDADLLAWEPVIPFDNEGLKALLTPTELSTPEQDLIAYLNSQGASSPEELAYWHGYTTPMSQVDIDRFLNDYSPEMHGYTSVEQWLSDWGAISIEEMASWFGYGSIGDPEAFANAYEFSSFQELATAQSATFVPPTLTQNQIDRIAANFLDYSPDVLTTALAYNPSLKTGGTFIGMQNDFAGAIADGSLASLGWSQTEIQNPLWLMFGNAAKNNSEGQLMGQLDFSAIDLAGKHLENMSLVNSNVNGGQLSAASHLTSVNMSGMNLVGFTGTAGSRFGASSNLSNTNLAGASLDGEFDVGAYSDFSGANLSGASFAGYRGNGYASSWVGANLSNVNFTGPQVRPEWEGHGHENGNYNGWNGNFTDAVLTGADFTNNAMRSGTWNGVVSGGIKGGDKDLGRGWWVKGGYIVGPNVNLTGANLSGINLSGVNLTGVVSSGLVVNASTVLPTGWQVVNGVLVR